jgi:long-chain fatty acid transport protein
MINSRLSSSLSLVLVLSSAVIAHGNGILRNGSGARSMGLGGSIVADPDDPLSAMSANPAGLAGISRPSVSLGAVGIYADATFYSRVDGPVGLTQQWGLAPEIALALPVQDTALTLGLSLVPEVMRLSEWRYTDAPGGLDGLTSYGTRLHSAEVISVRAAAGAGWKINDRWSAGAGIGVAHQEISLHAPFIFQNFAPLRGIKTPLDLVTDDSGAWNGDIGVLFRATERLTVGLNFRTATDISSKGSASGNADVQLQNLGLGGARPDFRYDATVETTLPRSLALGANWRASDRVRMSAQVDWVNWSDSFDTLVIHLANGNNADLNGIAGGDSLTDRIPLDWEDSFIFRVGVEYSPADRWWLRAGYACGGNPIPSRNLTPLNAAVSEHTLTAGVGYEGEDYRADFAWQYDLPHTGHTGASNILDGEYSNTSTSLRAHWFGLTFTRYF